MNYSKMEFRCWSCGKKLDTGNFYERNYCPKCLEAKNKKAKENFAEYWRLKNEMTLERAVRRIEQDHTSRIDISEYREAIDTVRDYVNINLQKLQSTEEYIALIIFLSHRTHVTCQKKILTYRVDFSLDDLKLIVEIDGERHKYKSGQDIERDLSIIAELGYDWDVMRIPADIVNNKPKMLYDAAVDYKIERKKYKENHKNEYINNLRKICIAKKRQHELLERNKEIKKQNNEFAHFLYSG